MNCWQKLAKPRKDQTSFTLVGTGHCAMPSSLTGPMVSSPGLMIIPRYSTSEEVKLHFSNLR